MTALALVFVGAVWMLWPAAFGLSGVAISPDALFVAGAVIAGTGLLALHRERVRAA